MKMCALQDEDGVFVICAIIFMCYGKLLKIRVKEMHNELLVFSKELYKQMTLKICSIAWNSICGL